MGMAASQARFLGLTARQNNVEYEGQQINQQRTLLSNQSANYYNDLLGMTVPTPPSVDAFTKTMYTFNDGALTNTITSMIAQANGLYTVSYLSKWQDDYAVVSAATSVVTQVDPANNLYAIGSANLRELGKGPVASYTPITVDGVSYPIKGTEPDLYYEKKFLEHPFKDLDSAAEIDNFEYFYIPDDLSEDDAKQVFKNADGKFYYIDEDNNNVVMPDITEDDLTICLFDMNETDPNKATTLVLPDSSSRFGYVKEDMNSFEEIVEQIPLTQQEIDEHTVYSIPEGSPFEGMTPSEIRSMLKEEAAWAELLRQKYGDDSWQVRYVTDTTTGTKKPYFYSLKDLQHATYDDTTLASLSNINCYTIGSEQKIAEFKGIDNCKIEKDSSGRLITICIPTTKDDGTTVYIDFALTTETATDQEAYNNAMNQYEYDKYLYDQAVEHINAKIEIIQAEDKNLELRLKQLDTEQKAISTEKEAVEKVIQKNTQDTFKTFNA